MSPLVLPRGMVQSIDRVADPQRHPGLQLDKFNIPGDQQAQKAALDKVCRIPGNSGLLASLGQRREQVLRVLPGASVSCLRTTGPLTLHLARVSALENAGLCLHPVYGFAYLPGSGLKGMGRAYAETVWLPTQTDQQQAWRQIEDVFGWAANPDRRQQISDPDWPQIESSSGNIVFHDAWPTAWPPLIVDTVNNNHPEYYHNDDDDHPPGDWENPVPVYFLTVEPGTTFSFALSKRSSDVPDELLDLARQWLVGALCHLGAGAKTNAGYGAFRPGGDVDASVTTAPSARSSKPRSN